MVANQWNERMSVASAIPRPCGISRPMPRGRPDAADAAAAAICAGRLQLPASGPLRRSRLSDPGRDPALRARPRFHRRRVRADRAATAHAKPRRSGAARQGDAVAFAVHNRPVKGPKGNYRVNLRHGVSRALGPAPHVGIIFHDLPLTAGSLTQEIVDTPIGALALIADDSGALGMVEFADCLGRIERWLTRALSWRPRRRTGSTCLAIGPRSRAS